MSTRQYRVVRKLTTGGVEVMESRGGILRALDPVQTFSTPGDAAAALALEGFRREFGNRFVRAS